MNRILLIGKVGQLGWELRRTLATVGEITAIDKDDIDLSNPDGLSNIIAKVNPNLIVNASAYTAVDKAESEADIAFTINAKVCEIIAQEAAKIGACIIHYSTDYVFDGTNTKPYNESDTPNPLSVYGRSKLEGENFIKQGNAPYLIFRTSWVYASRGKNFLLTILKLASEREELRIVNDQKGSPTSARMLAEVTAQIVAQGQNDLYHYIQQHQGVYHLTGGGETTWYDFTTKIIENAYGKENFKITNIIPITTKEYPTPAQRPQYSVMDNSKIKNTFNISIPNWEKGLELILEELKHD